FAYCEPRVNISRPGRTAYHLKPGGIDCPAARELSPVQQGRRARDTARDRHARRARAGPSRMDMETLTPRRDDTSIPSSPRPWWWWLSRGVCGVALALVPFIVVLTLLNRNVPDIWAIAEPQSAAL